MNHSLLNKKQILFRNENAVFIVFFYKIIEAKYKHKVDYKLLKKKAKAVAKRIQNTPWKCSKNKY